MLLSAITLAALACLMPQGASSAKQAKRDASPRAGVVAGALAAPRDAIPTSVRTSMRRPTAWLLRAQNRDGSWGDNFGSRGDRSNTCIAVLALYAAGNTTTRGRHAHAARRGVEYVLNRTRGYGASDNGLDSATLIQGKLGPNIDLYLSVVLFSQVLGTLPTTYEQKEVQALLARMSRVISSHQKKSGAFETSYEPMLTTVMAFLALRQTHDAGVSVRGASATKVLRYLERDCLNKRTGAFTEAKWNKAVRFVTQAGALRVFHGMGKADTRIGKLATDVILKMRFDQDVGGRTGGEEFLGAVFATQALFFDADERFWTWYAKICKGLLACQNADGSWTGHHCITGRVFCTSCSIITMRTPDKMLPMLFK